MQRNILFAHALANPDKRANGPALEQDAASGFASYDDACARFQWRLPSRFNMGTGVFLALLKQREHLEEAHDRLAARHHDHFVSAERHAAAVTDVVRDDFPLVRNVGSRVVVGPSVLKRADPGTHYVCRPSFFFLPGFDALPPYGVSRRSGIQLQNRQNFIALPPRTMSRAAPLTPTELLKNSAL